MRGQHLDSAAISWSFYGVMLLAVALGGGAAHAQSSDPQWGCKVVLCLANPAGPMSAAACVPPITALWQALSKAPPDPFPTCDQAKASGTYAALANTYYKQCPAPLTPLAAGVMAVLATPAQIAGNNYFYGGNEPVLTGIGDGSGSSPQTNIGDSGGTPMPPLVCVGKQVGTTITSTGSGEDETSTSANAYDQIVLIPADPSSLLVNVYVQNALFAQASPTANP